MQESKNKTEQNLLQALESELQLSTLYQLFSKQAKSEGYLSVADLFERTSKNELEHAGVLLELTHECRMPSTEENLYFAVSEELRGVYKAYAMQADADGFRETADLFRRLSEIEEYHGKVFDRVLKEIKSNTVYSKSEECIWTCCMCGARHRGYYAPQICPVCGYPQSCYSAENY